MKKLIIAGLLVAAAATPALAKSSKAYYIAQNAKTHKCMITTHKPTGDKVSYKTHAAAKKAMKGMKECKAS
jgi:hypothetical protein